MRHNWRIKRCYFDQLYTGEKSIEVRVGYNQIKKVKAGDFITFENYGENDFRVRRVSRYNTFEDLLAHEDVSKVLPGYTTKAALKALREIYPREKEALGVYVFELKNILLERKIYSASKLSRSSHKLFSKVLAESYNITDWIADDYPKHFEQFWTKYVPGIFSGEREIFAAYVGKHIAGVVILKKTTEEQKICTIYVPDEFRCQGIATALLQKSFEWLGTDKPLVTIADYKKNDFVKIIEQYCWTLTQTLERGYYNDHSRELVFNGTIM